MRIFLATIIILFFNNLLPAQFEERKDRLVFEQDTFDLCSSPLEYFSSFREKVFAVDSCIDEDCFRGYIAEWHLLNDTLFLTNVFSCCDNRNINGLAEEFFKTNSFQSKFFANWVEGTFKMNRNFHLESFERFVDQGFPLFVANEEIDLIFSNGILVDKIIYPRCTSEYSESDIKLKNFIYNNVNWNNLPYLSEDPLNIPVEFITDKKGNITYVWVENLKESVFTQEAIRLVKLIPNWEVYYDCGLVTIPRRIVIEFSTTMKKKYAH